VFGINFHHSGIAFAIACPAVWFGGKAWLKDFAFQTNLSWWIFRTAGFFTLILALTAISLQSLRAARQSP
jgi:putative ABC transport system permease protein